MTFKEPHPSNEGRLETHIPLNSQSAQDLIATGNVAAIKDLVEHLRSRDYSIDQLCWLGSITTHRAEVKLSSGLLVFDHSIYAQTEDWELEFETKTVQRGEKDFKALLHSHQIPRRPAANKIERFCLAQGYQ
ncbi:CYTH domain-containing protein [Litoribacterium kuwaitense]|uniref:CYTH domain-containing protein n=1 Tax=Litoribacterium kuwaitense TaxID=1398745 RepID=UPI0035E43FC7